MLSQLQNTSLDTPKFSLSGNIYVAKCVKCYDGDTIHAVFDLNGKFTRFVCRLAQINTPEMNNGGEIARDILRSKILDKLIVLRCGDFGKYGRLLVEIYEYPANVDELHFEDSINHYLLKEGYAVKY